MSEKNQTISIAKPHILVTGGLGYVGSHVCVELISAGCDISIVDIKSSTDDTLQKIATITHKDTIEYHKCNLLDSNSLQNVFQTDHKYDAVVHLAGYKSISESTTNPLNYYENNVVGSLNLIRAMEEHGCKNIIFASSSSVYGVTRSPVAENNSSNPQTPYARSKSFIENVLSDLSTTGWKVCILRYFNPSGAHSSGLLGDVSTNLVSRVSQVALGQIPYLELYGQDYDTKDGTCINDYIHVVDLAKGHVSALYRLLSKSDSLSCYNMGSEEGHSVLNVLNMYAKVSGKSIPVQVVHRNTHTQKELYSDCSKAKRELGWRCEHSFEDIIKSEWNFARNTYK